VTAPLTLFRARSVITMDPTHPTGSAVLVDGDRIAAVGSFDELPTSDCVVDDTVAEAVPCASFIDQHLHHHPAPEPVHRRCAPAQRDRGDTHGPWRLLISSRHVVAPVSDQDLGSRDRSAVKPTLA
jgi:hypothetical protein